MHVQQKFFLPSSPSFWAIIEIRFEEDSYPLAFFASFSCCMHMHVEILWDVTSHDLASQLGLSEQTWEGFDMRMSHIYHTYYIYIKYVLPGSSCLPVPCHVFGPSVLKNTQSGLYSKARSLSFFLFFFCNFKQL